MSTPAAVTTTIVARAPTRIDLGGGWTDVPPYCDREGGFVCNVAIARYAVAHVRPATDAAASSVEPPEPLLIAAARRAGLHGARVELRTGFPGGAGLGGSSAATAAVVGAGHEWTDTRADRSQIAEEGRRIEVEELGIAGGRQDHYAAVYGGALALTFTDRVDVRAIPMSDRTRADLALRSVLVYTGESRVSGDTITAVLDAYAARETRVVTALARMRELAVSMARALALADLDEVGRLMGEHWVHQRALHPTIPTARIDAIVEAAQRAGALGAKAMGASGGGCVLVVAPAQGTDSVREALRPLGELLPFEVDTDGLTVHRDRDVAGA